jgi:biopolymer transport protein TolQ
MSDPIIQSYFQSDFIGKLIFLGLGLLSVLSWTLIFYRARLLKQAQAHDLSFIELVKQNPSRILQLENQMGPAAAIYNTMRKHTIDILSKNRQFGASNSTGASLSMNDMEMIYERSQAEQQSQMYQLEESVHHLSTVVTLAPFLGLLGTVWGILISLSSLRSASSNEAVFIGLSMALATTVIGLIVAIPALLGHNHLKAWLKEFDNRLSEASSQILALIEIQYRRVDKE